MPTRLVLDQLCVMTLASTLSTPCACPVRRNVDGTQPTCFSQVDADGNRSVSFLVDSLYLLNAGFVPGSPPPPPHPDCGPDDNGVSTLGCDTPNPTCP